MSLKSTRKSNKSHKALITLRYDVNQHGSAIDILEIDYISYFEKQGLMTIPVPNNSLRAAEYAEMADILILSGGNDIQITVAEKEFQNHLNTNKITISELPQRDLLEYQLISEFILRKKPILGICRGMQLLNVYFGGTLKRFEDGAHLPARDHKVEILHDDLITLLGTNKSLVNSFHRWHVTIDSAAPELRAFALHDKVVEGIFHPNHPIAGIQWHPERRGGDVKLNEILINSLISKKLFFEAL